MSFHITIDQFEGPLDLMLHLIKEHKLDLFDLDMQILSEQYLQYIHAMESLHLEIASEYLLELSHLLEYKSKKLLPREVVVIEEEYEEDHREMLMKRLIEYQQYKEISQIFAERYEQRQLQMEKPVSEIVVQWTQTVEEGVIQGNPYDLMKSMRQMLRRIVLQKPLETRVTVKELSVDERNQMVLKRIQEEKKAISFLQLCNDCQSLQMVIVSFLSILDLIKRQLIQYYIDEKEMIWIEERERYT